MDLWALNQGGVFQIQFQGIVDEAAFGFITNPGTSTFTALLGGATVEQFSATTDLSNVVNFFGFEGIPFDTIEVSPGGTNSAFRFDNFQFSAVPEPNSLALLGLGFLAVCARLRQVTP